MAWMITSAQLEAERDAAAERVQERPGKVSYQRLGRALRWLDEEDAAREAFRDGATYMKTNVLDQGRSDNAAGWAEYGHLLRNAGDLDAAREAYQRALERLDDEASVRGAQLRYLLGQDPGAADDGVHGRALLALASHQGIEQARKEIVAELREEGGLPSYTAPNMTLWDLLEETFRVESELTGEPVPDHATMLARAGLLTSG